MPILNAQLAQLASLQTQVNDLTSSLDASVYTPTIAAGSGAFTTANARGTFTQLSPSLIYVEIEVKVVAHGTGSFIRVGLPQQPAQGFTQLLFGRENAIGGKALQGVVSSSLDLTVKNYVVIYNYDNSDPVVDGGVYCVSGVYKIAT